VYNFRAFIGGNMSCGEGEDFTQLSCVRKIINPPDMYGESAEFLVRFDSPDPYEIVLEGEGHIAGENAIFAYPEGVGFFSHYGVAHALNIRRWSTIKLGEFNLKGGSRE
jgi:hypothetical protein